MRIRELAVQKRGLFLTREDQVLCAELEVHFGAVQEGLHLLAVHVLLHAFHRLEYLVTRELAHNLVSCRGGRGLG